jgi:DUF438 domain-containing protein
MSKEINNSEYRRETLREIIAQLHDGKSVDDVKARFEAVFDGVSADEIAKAEQALIESGLPVEEIQRLCDVHAAVFKGSIEQIHAADDPSEIIGHPANTLKKENRAIEALIAKLQKRLAAPQAEGALEAVKSGLLWLDAIDLHYKKKENLLFPYLENRGITAPPKVMWGVDDEIRAELKAVGAALKAQPLESLAQRIGALFVKITEMIFKEEHILLPMLFENLTQAEWKHIADETDEIGYCLISPPPEWTPEGETEPPARPHTPPPGDIVLPTGVFKTEELVRMLDTLPIDITFVGKDDTVKYFSQSSERVFPRTKAIIGRDVSNCHPPASVHIVEKLVADFRAGSKDSEDFWINMGDKLILIRYFAVRSEAGEYLGVLEVTQNIKPLQAIEGEKRLMS